MSSQGLPKSRSEAIKRGSVRYYTGNPCKHGHISARYTQSGNCAECYLTVHLDLVRQGRKRRAPKDMAHRDGINAQKKSKAFNATQSWTLKDISLVMARDKSGAYLHSDSNLADMLGRSLRSIQRARHRYGICQINADRAR